MTIFTDTSWHKSYCVPSENKDNIDKAELYWSKASLFDKLFNRSELISKCDKIIEGTDYGYGYLKTAKPTMVRLKDISEQLTEVLNLPKGYKVAGLIEDGELLGWCVVEYDSKTGGISPKDTKKYKTIKELINDNTL